MIYNELPPRVKTALILCFFGSVLTLGALCLNNAVTLLAYLFIGQPLLLLGLFLYLTTVWRDLLKHEVFGNGKKPGIKTGERK